MSVAPQLCAVVQSPSPNAIKLRNSDHLVRSGLLLVQSIAGQLEARFGRVISHDDMVSLGNEGLVDAMLRFDPDRGVDFYAYASSRIRGAIVDGMRREAWMPRSAYAHAKADAGDRPFARSDAPVDDVGNWDRDHAPTPEDVLIQFEEHRAAREAVAELAPEHAELVRRYSEGESLRSISEDLGFAPWWGARTLPILRERIRRHANSHRGIPKQLSGFRSHPTRKNPSLPARKLPGAHHAGLGQGQTLPGANLDGLWRDRHLPGANHAGLGQGQTLPGANFDALGDGFWLRGAEPPGLGQGSRLSRALFSAAGDAFRLLGAKHPGLGQGWKLRGAQPTKKLPAARWVEAALTAGPLPMCATARSHCWCIPTKSLAGRCNTCGSGRETPTTWPPRCMKSIAASKARMAGKNGLRLAPFPTPACGCWADCRPKPTGSGCSMDCTTRKRVLSVPRSI